MSKDQTPIQLPSFHPADIIGAVKQGLMDAHNHLAATPLFQLDAHQIVLHLKHHIELLEAFSQMQATIKAQGANGGKEKRAN